MWACVSAERLNGAVGYMGWKTQPVWRHLGPPLPTASRGYCECNPLSVCPVLGGNIYERGCRVWEGHDRAACEQLEWYWRRSPEVLGLPVSWNDWCNQSGMVVCRSENLTVSLSPRNCRPWQCTEQQRQQPEHQHPECQHMQAVRACAELHMS